MENWSEEFSKIFYNPYHGAKRTRLPRPVGRSGLAEAFLSGKLCFGAIKVHIQNLKIYRFPVNDFDKGIEIREIEVMNLIYQSKRMIISWL